MRYVLAVLERVEPDETAERCLETFGWYAKPEPSVAVFYNGDHGNFCDAARSLWNDALVQARLNECDYVFWLPHDSLLTRPVALDHLAAVLRSEPLVAQMSLPSERVGGNEYQERLFDLAEDDAVPWLWDRSRFFTGPSLMRIEFMQTNPWPAYEAGCAERFGALLAGRGYGFGVWGGGEAWVDRIV